MIGCADCETKLSVSTGAGSLGRSRRGWCELGEARDGVAASSTRASAATGGGMAAGAPVALTWLPGVGRFRLADWMRYGSSARSAYSGAGAT